MICILKHLRVLVTTDGKKWEQMCGADGLEHGENMQEQWATVEVFDDIITLPNDRKYYCTCCKQNWPGEGEDDFEEVRKHLGKNWEN